MAGASVRRLGAGLLLWGWLTAGAAGAADEAADAPAGARELIRETVDALEIGQLETAQTAVTRLLAISPEEIAGVYLQGRLAAKQGHWEEAFEEYQRLLTLESPRLNDDWFQLISGRWVRARHTRDRERVRVALARETQPALIPGRTLVLPLEPLLLGASDATLQQQTAALGNAAAAWILRALGGATSLTLPTFREAWLLRRGQVSLDTGDAAVPPVSALEGVAHRLKALEPAGPPPWTPEAERPKRYLAASATPDQSRDVLRALTHFQIEHDLAATGVADPETRRLLERIYRETLARRTLRAPPAPGEDPVLAAARLAQVDIVLSGTLEPLLAGGWRWNVAWVSAADGRVLGAPLSGVLSPRLFSESWRHMLEVIVAAWPRAAEPAMATLPDTELPTPEGALLYGDALAAIEEGDAMDAARLFRAAARAGAGSTAAWFALAWSVDAGALELLEARLLREAILGPVHIDVALIRALGGFLARDLQTSGAGAERPAGLDPRGTLGVYPQHGWLRVIGSID
jgi:tetratricopeptide (TPR) repeat protein